MLTKQPTTSIKFNFQLAGAAIAFVLLLILFDAAVIFVVAHFIRKFW